jgi:hypothetical protein
MDTTYYIISAWTDIIQYFFPIFTAPTAKIFINLLSGWVLCTAKHTITGILPFAEPDRHRAHDAYHRFFPDASWAMSELWRFLTILLVKIFYPTGTIYLDLDDTVFHHSGKKVDGAGWWRDAVRSSGKTVIYAWGLNLVILTIRVYPPWGCKPLGLPINMRLHRKNGLALPELAEEMLKEVVLWLDHRRFLCHCDGFYATLAGHKITNIDITSRMRRDATIYDMPLTGGKTRRGRPKKKGKKLLKPQQMAKRIRNFRLVKSRQAGKEKKRLVYARKVLWYRVSQEPVLMVINRDPAGKEKDDFIYTTDLSLTAEQVVGDFLGRWSIEDTIKNTKQLLGGQEPQTRKGRGPERAAAMSFWLFSIIWLWYLQRRTKHRTFVIQPWYPGKLEPSFADALSCLRGVLWRQRIKIMFGKNSVHDKKFEFLIEALAAAA